MGKMWSWNMVMERNEALLTGCVLLSSPAPRRASSDSLRSPLLSPGWVLIGYPHYVQGSPPPSNLGYKRDRNGEPIVRKSTSLEFDDACCRSSGAEGGESEGGLGDRRGGRLGACLSKEEEEEEVEIWLGG